MCESAPGIGACNHTITAAAVSYNTSGKQRVATHMSQLTNGVDRNNQLLYHTSKSTYRGSHHSQQPTRAPTKHSHELQTTPTTLGERTFSRMASHASCMSRVCVGSRGNRRVNGCLQAAQQEMQPPRSLYILDTIVPTARCPRMLDPRAVGWAGCRAGLATC